MSNCNNDKCKIIARIYQLFREKGSNQSIARRNKSTFYFREIQTPRSLSPSFNGTLAFSFTQSEVEKHSMWVLLLNLFPKKKNGIVQVQVIISVNLCITNLLGGTRCKILKLCPRHYAKQCMYFIAFLQIMD